MKSVIKLSILLAIFSFLFTNIGYTQDCTYSESWALETMMKDCTPRRLITADNYKIADKSGVKTRVEKVIRAVSGLSVLLFIVWFVISWYILVTSAGEDEKMTTAKKALIACIIWFLFIVSAQPLVNIIVNFVYRLWQS